MHGQRRANVKSHNRHRPIQTASMAQLGLKHSDKCGSTKSAENTMIHQDFRVLLLWANIAGMVAAAPLQRKGGLGVA